ncbi:MAG: sensor domain-containing diguanylate cyclase [Chromatiales bacterium]|nr:sensor domain-containing diguanylate cyclase [Chromatiales bacterium]
MRKKAYPIDQPRDPQEEIHLLRQRLLALSEEAHKNEAVLKRFHERELSLLTCDSLPLLLNYMTEGMKKSFDLPYITLILLDESHELRHLLLHTNTHPEDLPEIRFLDSCHEFDPAVRYLSKPRLGIYVQQNHETLLSTKATDIGSVALLPMLRNGQLVGCLNMGSRDPYRFTRHHASDFLNRLATIGAICLENVANREHLVISGLTDALTGLHNRRYLERRLSEEISRAQRYQHPLSCLFIDADHFKQVNDNHGHHAGDMVLRELALRISECLRASDIAIRYGGEEFTLVLPQTSLQEASQLAERIRKSVSRQAIPLRNDQELAITVSIGVSTLTLHPEESAEESGERLLNSADKALYDAKNSGRNRVVVATSSK